MTTVRGNTTVRAAVATEADAPKKVKKESRKDEEGLSTNVYKPKDPYVGRCLLNSKIVGDDAPGETWHMVFSTEGMCSVYSLNYTVFVLSVYIR